MSTSVYTSNCIWPVKAEPDIANSHQGRKGLLQTNIPWEACCKIEGQAAL